MALSRIVYTGDGSTTQYAIPFALGYIEQSDVTCRVGTEIDGSGNPAYRSLVFNSPTLVTILGAVPGNGVKIVFDRSVDRDNLIINYEADDIITKETLNTAQKQAIMLTHEALDGKFSSFQADLDLNGFRILNLAPATAPDDAVTYQQVIDLALGGGTIVIDPPDGSITAAKLALNSVLTAKIADGAVTFAKVNSAAVSLAANTNLTSDVAFPTVAKASKMISNRERLFNNRILLKAAVLPSDVEDVSFKENNVINPVFKIGVPSVVKPWHIQQDNGQYLEQRFPDGLILANMLGAAFDDVTDDTAAMQYVLDYQNRNFWFGGGSAVEKHHRAKIILPPGIARITPSANGPLQLYDGMYMEGLGPTTSMFRFHTTAAGIMFGHTFSTATPAVNSRATNVHLKDFRIIPTGASQISIDARHCGRILIDNVTITTQDHYDEYFNAKQTVLTSSRGILLGTSDTLQLGGDVACIQNCHIYFQEFGVQGGYGTAMRTPEHVKILNSEISNCFSPIIFGGTYGGGAGMIRDCTIQRWGPNANGGAFNTGTYRAIDTTGRRTNIAGVCYFETQGNSIPPILFRTGSSYCHIDTRMHINYTATETPSHVSTELVTNDSSVGTSVVL